MGITLMFFTLKSQCLSSSFPEDTNRTENTINDSEEYVSKEYDECPKGTKCYNTRTETEDLEIYFKELTKDFSSFISNCKKDSSCDKEKLEELKRSLEELSTIVS